MEAKEIRLNNWILDRYGKEGFVTGIQGNGYVMIHERQRLHPVNFCEGIPLSEEWLKRLGLDRIKHFTVTNSYTLDLGRGRVLCVGSVGTPNLMVIVQEIEEWVKGDVSVTNQIVLHNWDYDGEMYVHQLQNLVYSIAKIELTQTELTIKEK